MNNLIYGFRVKVKIIERQKFVQNAFSLLIFTSLVHVTGDSTLSPFFKVAIGCVN